MPTGSTLLSKTNLELLEKLIPEYGNKTVTFKQIAAKVGQEVSLAALRTRVADLVKAGWLIRLKKGSTWWLRISVRWVFPISQNW